MAGMRFFLGNLPPYPVGRRVQPHRFFDHLSGVGQRGDPLHGRCQIVGTEHLLGLDAHALLHVGMAAEQMQRKRQRGRGGFVAGEQETST
jgi:hypothetical protein